MGEGSFLRLRHPHLFIEYTRKWLWTEGVIKYKHLAENILSPCLVVYLTSFGQSESTPCASGKILRTSEWCA